LRHAIAGDSGAGNLAIEVRIRGVTRRDPQKLGHLNARVTHSLRVGGTGGQLLIFLMRQAVMTSEGGAGGGEDFGLNTSESCSRVDWFAADAGRRRKLR